MREVGRKKRGNNYQNGKIISHRKWGQNNHQFLHMDSALFQAIMSKIRTATNKHVSEGGGVCEKLITKGTDSNCPARKTYQSAPKPFYNDIQTEYFEVQVLTVFLEILLCSNHVSFEHMIQLPRPW